MLVCAAHDVELVATSDVDWLYCAVADHDVDASVARVVVSDSDDQPHPAGPCDDYRCCQSL